MSKAGIKVIVTISDEFGTILEHLEVSPSDFDHAHKAIETPAQLSTEIRQRLEMKFEIFDGIGLG